MLPRLYSGIIKMVIDTMYLATKIGSEVVYLATKIGSEVVYLDKQVFNAS